MDEEVKTIQAPLFYHFVCVELFGLRLDSQKRKKELRTIPTRVVGTR